MRQRIAFASAALIVAVLPLAAPLLAANHPLVADVLRSFFNRLCHQEPARSFRIEGSPVAVCARCLGVYFGVALAALGGAWKLRAGNSAIRRFFFISVLLNLTDVVMETLRMHGNLPVLRFFLGLFLGFAAGALLVSREDRRRRGLSLPDRPAVLR